MIGRSGTILLLASLGTLTARAQVPLTSSLSCTSFDEWTHELAQMKKPDNVSYVRGQSAEINLISEDGTHPEKKQSYELMISGFVKRQADKNFRGQFQLEAHTPGDMKRIVFRKFYGTRVTWFDGKQDAMDLPVGKKLLVWAGSKGPNEEWASKLPLWVDLFRNSKNEFATVVVKDSPSLSEQGTIYYFPEGILEIFTAKEPLKKSYQPRRIYLWGGGCVEGIYPSPWPSL